MRALRLVLGLGPGLFNAYVVNPWDRPRRAFLRRRSSASADGSASAAGPEDVNALMTLLNVAVQREDYLEAARVKQRLDDLEAAQQAAQQAAFGGDDSGGGGGDVLLRRPGLAADWITLGTASWLAHRLGILGYRFATPCQARTMGSLLKMKVATGLEADGSESSAARLEEEWRDLAIRAPTG